MKYYITLLLCFVFQASFSQTDCDCQNDLKYVINYYEHNLPGFKDNVTTALQADYDAFKSYLHQQSKGLDSKTRCYKLLVQYVEFFKDNHSSIYMQVPRVDENDSKQVADFLKSPHYKASENIKLTKAQQQQYPLDDIRGIYEIKDGTYTIAVIPNKTPLRDYVGIIIASKSPLWSPGQVKLELKKNPNTNSYQGFSYLRNHAIRYHHNLSFKAGILGDSWFKTSLKERINHATDIENTFFYKQLDSQTAYIRIPTFSGGRSAKIDSLYKAAFPKIRNSKQLIIDVRNNGGGDDSNALPLLEFMYTQKIKTDKIDLYVTPDNIKMWERWYHNIKKDTLNYSKEDVRWFEDQISMQKTAKPYTFITRSESDYMEKEYPANAVQKVAIIYNKYSASSCESLLFWAMQSSKTILVGENSGGYVGYGEIGQVNTPCFDFALGCTMTRYETQRAYEAEGIPPNHYLDNATDWVEQTLKLLDQTP